MREGKRAPTVVGGISLLVIFAVLCLTVFLPQIGRAHV